MYYTYIFVLEYNERSEYSFISYHTFHIKCLEDVALNQRVLYLKPKIKKKNSHCQISLINSIKKEEGRGTLASGRGIISTTFFFVFTSRVITSFSCSQWMLMA